MLRSISVLLVILGVAISAIAGATLAPAAYETSLAQGRETLGKQPAGPPIVASPEARLTSWATEAGGPFLVGLVVLLGGAVLGRVAARGALGDEGRDRGAVDFGQLLRSLSEEVSRLAEEMSTGVVTEGRLHEIRDRLERMQADRLDLLIAAGPRLQLRHGSEGFAAVFSPLSAAERRLNRAWSALVDSHWAEAVGSVEEAARELESSLQELEARTAAP